MCSEDCNNRVSAYAIKGICIAGNDTFQRMVFQNIFLKSLFVFGLAGHRRLWDNHCCFCPFCEGIQQMLYKRQFILRRILFTTLGVRRVHHADCSTFKLYLRWILAKEIFTLDITVAVITEDHIGSSNSKHITLEFKPVQLLLLNVLSLVLISTYLFKHVMHRCNKKSGGTTTRVKYNIRGLNI